MQRHRPIFLAAEITTVTRRVGGRLEALARQKGPVPHARALGPNLQPAGDGDCTTQAVRGSEHNRRHGGGEEEKKKEEEDLVFLILNSRRRRLNIIRVAVS